jgi:hypothetical protein
MAHPALQIDVNQVALARGPSTIVAVIVDMWIVEVFKNALELRHPLRASCRRHALLGRRPTWCDYDERRLLIVRDVRTAEAA